MDARYQVTLNLPTHAGGILKRPGSEGGGRSHGYLLLHGYSETGKRINEKLRDALPSDAVIFAPDGLYPMPVRSREHGLKEGYAWYLYNPLSDEYIRDMHPAREYLLQLREALRLDHEVSDWTIIGFSQGGYFAPFLAERWPGVIRVIGLCASFLPEEMERAIPSYSMHLILGEDDEIVARETIEGRFRQLVDRGVDGSLKVLKSVGHRIDERLLSELKLLIFNNKADQKKNVDA